MNLLCDFINRFVVIEKHWNWNSKPVFN